MSARLVITCRTCSRSMQTGMSGWLDLAATAADDEIGGWWWADTLAALSPADRRAWVHQRGKDFCSPACRDAARAVV